MNPPPSADLLGRLLAEVGRGGTTLGPLSAEACAQLVRRRFPEAADSFCAECARVTGGNPLLLNELLQAVATSGGATDDPAAERLHETSSVSLQRSTSLRLSGVGAAGQAVAEAVAVLEPSPPLRRVAALAGLTTEDAASAADALVRAGVLASSDPPAFAHPLLQSTVRSAIPDAERGIRHLRAAALAHEEGAVPEQVAAQLIRSTPQGEDWVVAALRAAADDARSRGAAESACCYLERALEEPPSAEERAHVLAELAEAELLTGKLSALERLDQASRAAVDPETESAVLMRIGDVLFQSGKYDEAAEVFDRALRQQRGGDAELHSRLRVCRLAMETLRPGGKVGPDLVDVPDEQLDAGGRFLRTHLALASVMGVTDHEQTRRLARGALADGAMLREQGIGLDLMVALGCLIWSDLFDECDEEVERGLAVAERQASHLGRANLLFGRAWARYWSGRLAESVEDSLAAIEPWRGGWNGQIHFARFWCAVALVELDRLDEAQAVVDEPDSPGHRRRRRRDRHDRGRPGAGRHRSWRPPVGPRAPGEGGRGGRRACPSWSTRPCCRGARRRPSPTTPSARSRRRGRSWPTRCAWPAATAPTGRSAWRCAPRASCSAARRGSTCSGRPSRCWPPRRRAWRRPAPGSTWARRCAGPAGAARPGRCCARGWTPRPASARSACVTGPAPR